MLSGGILFLVHRGAAFIDDLLALAGKLGLESYVLTSAPPAESVGRLDSLRSRSTWLQDVAADSLTARDVQAALDALGAQGRNVLGCLSVWEGYRLYMAEANARLSTPDESIETLARLMDKYVSRKRLLEQGLSAVRTDLVTPALLEELRREKTRKFIKPRRGLASFGAFAYKPDLTWEALQAVLAEMATDPDFRDVFEGARDFIAEDYIEGHEFSFEAIVCDGELFLIGVHEKVQLDERHGATLETASLSPPLSLSTAQLQEANTFLERSLRALGVTTGCLHIEARFSGSRWEIIEVNPRVGGSFINHSVRVTTDGECMLDLWLRTLLARTEQEKAELKKALAAKSIFSEAARARTSGVYFRVYFGEPGRRIRETVTPPSTPAPELLRVIVPAGVALPNSSREVFVAQALWRLSRASLETDFLTAQQASAAAVEIRYE
jgi:biotin carboxylase